MDRKEMLRVVEEAKKVISSHKVTPIDSESIAQLLLDNVKETNSSAVKKYMETGEFDGGI